MLLKSKVAETVKHRVLGSKEDFKKIMFGPGAGAIIHYQPDGDGRRLIGFNERELAPYLRKMIKPGMTAFDIGAERGFYAAVIGKMTGSRVVAVEADPKSLEILEKVKSLNDFDMIIEPCFVSKSATEENGITLDALALRHFMPDFIKMDIEGHEAAALYGASAILSNAETSFIIETHDRDIEESCMEQLLHYKYSVEKVHLSKLERSYRTNARGWLVATPSAGD